MSHNNNNIDNSVWKLSSLAFSRSAILDAMRYRDFSQLNWVLMQCEEKEKIVTYMDLMDLVYSNMLKHYRCEYVYKNEIVRHLIKNYRNSVGSVVFNEFKVSDSIADIAIFNGESKAFEIKTEYDSKKRLKKQINAYRLVFDKCYVVIPQTHLDDYIPVIDDNSGIVTFSYQKGRVNLTQYREAKQNDQFDVGVLMKCLRIKEYEHIIVSYFRQLPDVSSAEMYDACLVKMRQIPTIMLKQLFLNEIKNRKISINQLGNIPKSIIQLCVSLNLKDKEIPNLINTLNTKIS